MQGGGVSAASGVSATSGVTVACCQIGPRVGELAANRAACREVVRRAAGEGARIVVLAELVDGPTVTEWLTLADQLGITLVGGLCELGDDGLLYNTAVIVAGPRVL